MMILLEIHQISYQIKYLKSSAPMVPQLSLKSKILVLEVELQMAQRRELILTENLGQT